MAIILSLETSSRICAVALHKNAELLALAEIHQDQAHASKLALLIDDIIRIADVGMNSIDAVAVSSGPGSYTGLRIGTSTAKGLCYALSVPLIAVGTLELMASQVSLNNQLKMVLCPMIDAGRMEVYCSLFNADGEMLHPVEARIIDETSFVDDLNTRPILFFGSGAGKCRQVISHVNAFFMDNIYPSAGHLGKMASIRHEAGQTEDLFGFEPFYLKEFKAKLPRNLISGMLNKS